MVSTKEIAKELEKFISGPGAVLLFKWMEAVTLSLQSTAAQNDAGTITAVAALKVKA
jgi:hypothetical protein